MALIDEPPSQRLEVRRCDLCGWLVASTLIPLAALLACILYFEVCSGAAFDVGYCYRALSTKWQTPFICDSDKLAKRSVSFAGTFSASIGDEVQSAAKTQLAQLDICTANQSAKTLSVIHTPRIICSMHLHECISNIQADKTPQH